MQRVLIPLACLFLTACRGASRVDSVLEPFIPPDTVALADIHMDLLRAAPLYRKLAESGRLPRLDEFRAAAGFDPERDVTELLLANDGKNSLVIASGTFPNEPGQPRVAVYRGYPLYGRNPGGVFTFIGGRIALAGPAPLVRAAIDQFKSGHDGAPAALLDRLRALPGDSQIRAVASGWSGFPPDAAREMGNAQNLNRVLQSVAAASLTASFQAGMHVAATADCRSEPEAAKLADNLRGLAGLVRLTVPEKQPDLRRVFDAIQVQADGRSVRLSLDIPEDLAERLADLWR